MLRVAGLILAAFLLCASAGETAPGKALTHVQTAVYCCHGYANDTVLPQLAAPVVNWATTDLPSGAEADRAAGIEHVVHYIDASRSYTTSPHYKLVADGGDFANARAVSCSGQIVRTNHPEGFLMDPFNPATVQVLNWTMDRWFNAAYNVYFFDDVDAFRWDLANGPPCTGNPPTPWSEPATAKAYANLLASVRVHGTVVPQIIFNGLAAYFDKPDLHLIPLNVLSSPNVIGGMCEGCYGDNTPDRIKSGVEWQDDLDIEIKTVHLRKIFWDYVRYINNDPNARIYTFASFMLAWDPQYSIYQTAYKPETAGQLHVTPETGIVAYDPVKRDVAAFSDLRDPGGAYVREYRNCYYRGAPIGPCAFVVNSDALPHPRPNLTLAYHHTIQISGGMILEGGTVSPGGPDAPNPIPGMHAFILTR